MKRFDVGARVHEATYGLGSVIAVEDAFTRIQFDDNTVRKFLTSIAKIEPSNEPPPTTRPRTRKRKTAKAKPAPKPVKSDPDVEAELDAEGGDSN